jgi:hypothetical protein
MHIFDYLTYPFLVAFFETSRMLRLLESITAMFALLQTADPETSPQSHFCGLSGF